MNPLQQKCCKGFFCVAISIHIWQNFCMWFKNVLNAQML